MTEGINFAHWCNVGLKGGVGSVAVFVVSCFVMVLGSHPYSILSKELHGRSEVWRVAPPFIGCRSFQWQGCGIPDSRRGELARQGRSC